MRGGLWILNFFALVWCAAGLFLSHQSLLWLVVPVAISGAILFWASRMMTATVSSGGSHVGRLIAIWSTVEGVAMFVASNVLINLKMPDALMPVLAIIVGLHFLPIARGIPVRLYYATGAALMAVGTVALIAPPWHLPLATGVVAAAILWLSAIGLVTRRA